MRANIHPAHALGAAGLTERSCRCAGSVKTKFCEMADPHTAAALRRCSMIVGLRRARLGIEPGKQQQPGEKAADMGLPSHRLTAAGDRKRAQSEQKVDAEPDCDKKHNARIGQAHCAAESPVRDTRCRRPDPTMPAVHRAETKNASPPPSCRRSRPMRRSSEIVRRHGWPDARRRPPPPSPQRTPENGSYRSDARPRCRTAKARSH